MNYRHLDLRPWIRRLGGPSALSVDQQLALERVLSGPFRFAPGETLVTPGDSAQYAILVLSGMLGRVLFADGGERRISSVLIAGDLCSCGLALALPIDYSLVALSRGQAARITAADLRVLQTSSPDLMLPISRSIIEETLVGRARLLNTIVRPGRVRVAHLLSELHWRLDAVGLVTGYGCRIPMVQRDIAAAVGLSTIQVNRVLQELRDEGCVALGRGALDVLAIARLRAVGKFEPNYLEVRFRPADDLAWRGVGLH